MSAELPAEEAVAILEEASRRGIVHKRPSGAQAESFLQWYLRQLGYEKNRWGSYDKGKRRIKFTARNIQIFTKGSASRWVKLGSHPMIGYAADLIKLAASHGTTEQKEQVEAQAKKTTAKKKKAKAKATAKAQAKLLEEHAGKLTEYRYPEGREIAAQYALGDPAAEDRYGALYQDTLDHLKGIPNIATMIPKRDDRLVSLSKPPFRPLFAPDMSYQWVEDRTPIELLSKGPGWGQKMVVRIGTMGSLTPAVDPVTLKIEVPSFFWDEGEVDFQGQLAGYIQVQHYDSGSLFEPVLVFISASERHRGYGTFLLRLWCRLLQGYGLRQFVAVGIGEEGMAFLDRLHEKGQLTVEIIPGTKTALVTCAFSPARKLPFTPSGGSRRLFSY